MDPQHELLTRLGSQMNAVHQTLGAMAQNVESLARQQEIIQDGMRKLGTRVTDAASSLGAPRVRELYMRLLLMYDLVEPPPAHVSSETAAMCRLIATQIEQFLAVNGFSRIEIDGGVFDMNCHKPIKQEPVDDPCADGCVIAIVQHGFRSPHGVLRPASVVIGRLREQATTQLGTAKTSPKPSEPQDSERSE